jgi:hypothetical protein
MKLSPSLSSEGRSWIFALRRRLAPLVVGLATGLAAPVGIFAAGEADQSGLPEAQPQALVEASAAFASAQTQTDAAEQAKLLDKARTTLETFLKDNPTHKDTALVQLQLGTVVLTTGKIDFATSKQAAAEADREPLVNSARTKLREAERLFTTVVDQYTQQTKSNPQLIQAADSSDRELRRRQRFLGNFIEAQFKHAEAMEELAATYPAGSVDAHQNYQGAADRYDRIYKNYRTLLAGLNARVKQGECYKNLNEPRRALGILNDITSQPDLQPLHKLRITAMYLSQECWNLEREKMYELAFSQGEEYLAGLPSEEELWPEWQAVRYQTARGYLLAATKQKDGAANPNRSEWLAKSREHAGKVAEQSGSYRKDAQELLADLAKLDAAGGAK